VRLAALKSAASSSVNVMPLILDAVRAYASVGEICNTLREVFGEYKEHIVV
jgi:methylmalonyl-CoA mutase, N-terminal domain